MGWVTVNGKPRFYEDSRHTCSECKSVIPITQEDFDNMSNDEKDQLWADSEEVR